MSPPFRFDSSRGSRRATRSLSSEQFRVGGAFDERVEHRPAGLAEQVLRDRAIDFLDEAIDRLSEAIEEQLGPFGQAQVQQCTIPGVQRRAAEVIVAETALT